MHLTICLAVQTFDQCHLVHRQHQFQLLLLDQVVVEALVVAQWINFRGTKWA
jgi:hypothetical protein